MTIRAIHLKETNEMIIDEVRYDYDETAWNVRTEGMVLKSTGKSYTVYSHPDFVKLPSNRAMAWYETADTVMVEMPVTRDGKRFKQSFKKRVWVNEHGIRAVQRTSKSGNVWYQVVK